LKKGGGYDPGRYFAGELPVSGANKAQIMGTAVFRGSKMVGTINGEETRYYLMLRGDFENGFFTFVDPVIHEPALIGFTVHQARSPKYVTNINEDGTVTIDVDIYLEADLSAMLKGINYENPDLKPIIEEAFSMYIQQGCQNLIKRTQEEFKADIFSFGYRLKHHFWTVQTWRDFNWLERYPEAQVSVTVHTRVRRTGLVLKTSPSKED